jgi:hypothetical protein
MLTALEVRYNQGMETWRKVERSITNLFPRASGFILQDRDAFLGTEWVDYSHIVRGRAIYSLEHS